MKIIGTEGMMDFEIRNELQKGAKFVMYQYVISILIMTFKRPTDIYFIKSDDSAVVKGLPFTLLSLVLGWWGIPWGPIYTIQALWINLQGGRDVTAQVLSAAQQASTANKNPS
jgi:hypothetical protein